MIPTFEGFTGSLPFKLADKVPSVTMVTTGHLELIEGQIFLVEHTANQRYSYQNVAIARTAWNRVDGSVAMPKLWIWKDGQLIQQGDILLISFINGDFHSPIIQGSLDMLATRHAEKDLRYNHSTGEDYNKEVRIIDNDKIRMIVKHDGAGEVEISIHYKGSNVDRKIIVSDKEKHKGIELITDHINITDGKETLADLLNDTIQAIRNITLNTPSGTTLPSAINDSEFENMQKRVKSFLELK